MMRKICVALLVVWSAGLYGAQPTIPEPLKELLDKMPPISFTGPAAEFDNALATIEANTKRVGGEWDERAKKFAVRYRDLHFAIDSALVGYYEQLKKKRLQEIDPSSDVSKKALKKIKAGPNTRDPKKWKMGVDYIQVRDFDTFLRVVFSKILQTGQAAIYFNDLLKIQNLGTQNSTFELNQNKAQVLEEYLSLLKSIGILLIADREQIILFKDAQLSTLAEVLAEIPKILTERQRYTHYLKAKMEAKIAEADSHGKTVLPSLLNPLIYFVDMLAFFGRQSLQLFQLRQHEWKTKGIDLFRKNIKNQLATAKKEKTPTPFMKLLEEISKRGQDTIEDFAGALSEEIRTKSDALEQVTYQLEELAAAPQ